MITFVEEESLTGFNSPLLDIRNLRKEILAYNTILARRVGIGFHFKFYVFLSWCCPAEFVPLVVFYDSHRMNRTSDTILLIHTEYVLIDCHQ